MKLFVWENVDWVSGSYHSDGGIAVVAESAERARALISEATKHAENPCEALTKEPDQIRECEGPEYIVVFPDAGCC